MIFNVEVIGNRIRFTPPDGQHVEEANRPSRFGPAPRSLTDHLAEKVIVLPSGCWEWTGSVSSSDGYGRLTIGSKATGTARRVKAHRLMWETTRSEVISGDIDHTCHNADAQCPGGKSCAHRRCVNPDHLRDVSRRTNLLAGRGFAATRAVLTVCKHGHPFTPANTVIRKNGTRKCRACANERRKQYPRYT